MWQPFGKVTHIYSPVVFVEGIKARVSDQEFSNRRSLINTVIKLKRLQRGTEANKSNEINSSILSKHMKQG